VDETSMTFSAAAAAAAVISAATGALDAGIRGKTTPGAIVLGAVAGVFVGLAVFAAFVAAGIAISVLTFSSAIDPWPALLALGIGCVAFLVVRTLVALLAPRFGMPAAPPSGRRRSFDDLFEGQARGGMPTMWLAGVVMALLPFLYGVRCIITKQGDLGTTLWPAEVHGGAAVALGLGWIGLAAFIHFHFFFGLHPGLRPYCRGGKTIALVLACSGMAIAATWSVLARVP
jgi:hypothetical protein